MDGLDTLLADFNRLKENCRKLEGQKIVVGIVGKAGSDVRSEERRVGKEC